MWVAHDCRAMVAAGLSSSRAVSFRTMTQLHRTEKGLEKEVVYQI